MNVQRRRIADVLLWCTLAVLSGLGAGHVIAERKQSQFDAGYSAGFAAGLEAGIADGRDTLVCWGIKRDRVTPTP